MKETGFKHFKQLITFGLEVWDDMRKNGIKISSVVPSIIRDSHIDKFDLTKYYNI